MIECNEKLVSYLHEQGVAFETQHHRRVYTAQEVAHQEHVPGTHVAKVVVVWVDGSLAMLVLPATHRVDLERFRTAIGAEQVRLAHEAETAVTFTDCEVGAMPPFGNLYDLSVYVDPALAEAPTIVAQAGTHTDTVSVRYADFARLVEPTVVPFAYHA